MKLLKMILLAVALVVASGVQATDRRKMNFNAGWRLAVGDFAEASKPGFDDARWQQVTLPYAFNGGEAFRKDVVDLTDTVCWYRKTFEVMGDGCLVMDNGCPVMDKSREGRRGSALAAAHGPDARCHHLQPQ